MWGGGGDQGTYVTKIFFLIEISKSQRGVIGKDGVYVCVCVAYCGGVGLDGRAALCPTHESKVDPWLHLIQRHLQPTQREGGERERGGRGREGGERGREGGEREGDRRAGEREGDRRAGEREGDRRAGERHTPQNQ